MPQYPLAAPPQPLRCVPPAHDSQLLQLPWPVTSWNCAATHALQLGSPAVEYEPAAQSVHPAWPSRDWYRPEMQSTQCAEEVPAPDPAILPATQATHTD